MTQQYEQDAMALVCKNCEIATTMKDAVSQMNATLTGAKDLPSVVSQSSVKVGSIYLMKIIMHLRIIEQNYVSAISNNPNHKHKLRDVIHRANSTVSLFRAMKGHESYKVAKRELCQFYTDLGGKLDRKGRGTKNI